MSAWTIFYICAGLCSAAPLVYAVWLDREPRRRQARYRRELPARITETRQQIRQLFRDSERRMERLAGRRDQSGSGPWYGW